MSALRLDNLTPAQREQIMRDYPDASLEHKLIKDKSYQQSNMGQEVKAYLRVKSKRMTPQSERDYEGCLARFALYFPDHGIDDFEPPDGTRLIEEFLDHYWGDREPRTWNKNLSIVTDYFKFQRIRLRMRGDPLAPIERAKSPQVYRTTFNLDQRRAILAAAENLRDRIALRLLLDYGLRKGALKVVQFKHFDYHRRRLTIFTKGQKVRDLPLPQAALWSDLEQHVLEVEARPNHFLMCRYKIVPRAGHVRFPEKPMGDHGLHNWWYARLTAAGVVAEGTTKGEKMHKARHTAGQRLLDATGNLKAVQKLLGHASISTTADVYVDWDIEALTLSMADLLKEDE